MQSTIPRPKLIRQTNKLPDLGDLRITLKGLGDDLTIRHVHAQMHNDLDELLKIRAEMNASRERKLGNFADVVEIADEDDDRKQSHLSV